MDSVSISFELMRLELDNEVDSLNAQGMRLFGESQYVEAKELSERGQDLSKFCASVEELESLWERKFSSQFPKSEAKADATTKKILSASKSSKSGLLIRFPDGTTIAEKTAAETLTEVVKRVGFEKVSALKILVNNENLVSKIPSQKYNEHEVFPFFIKTHSSTMQKKKNLERMSKELNLGLEIKIIS